MVTTVCDVARGGSAVGSGELISEGSYDLMVNPGTVAVGERSDDCPSCIPMTEELHFGMGITVAGDWLVQTPLFTGIAGIQAYLPAEDLSIAITNTYDQGVTSASTAPPRSSDASHRSSPPTLTSLISSRTDHRWRWHATGSPTAGDTWGGY